MIEFVASRLASMAVLAAGGAAGVLVTAQAIPVIGGFQAGLVDMVLVAVVGLALELRGRKRIGDMAATAGDHGTFRALGMTTIAASAAGTVAGGVVVAAGAIAGDLDMGSVIEVDRFEQTCQPIESDLVRRTVRGSGNAARHAQQPNYNHAENVQE